MLEDFPCCDAVAFVRFPSVPLALVPQLWLQADQHVGTINSILPKQMESQRIHFPDRKLAGILVLTFLPHSPVCEHHKYFEKS